jgi:CO dehydrogenase/acetyl-CoA synthase alpha subunit
MSHQQWDIPLTELFAEWDVPLIDIYVEWDVPWIDMCRMGCPISSGISH